MTASEWPTHDNKAWQAVLDRIRVLGWPIPHWTSSHPSLVMECPANSPQCKIRALSTGKGTESVAINALRRADRCPHRVITSVIAAVDENLAAAERLIDGAELLAARGAIDGRITELLELASTPLDQATAQLVNEEFDVESEKLGQLEDPEPDIAGHTPLELVNQARTPLRSAKITLKDLPTANEEVQVRRAELKLLTQRRDALRLMLPPK